MHKPPAMSDKFWNQYVLTIMERLKWFKTVKPLQVNDVVIIMDEDDDSPTFLSYLST